jgi:hypothetical protein
MRHAGARVIFFGFRQRFRDAMPLIFFRHYHDYAIFFDIYRRQLLAIISLLRDALARCVDRWLLRMPLAYAIFSLRFRSASADAAIYYYFFHAITPPLLPLLR